MRKLPLDRARRALLAGRYRRALRLAWDATNQALPREDRATVEDVQIIAYVIADSADAATAARAKQLALYCRACLGSASGQLSAPSELARLLQRGRNLRGGG